MILKSKLFSRTDPNPSIADRDLKGFISHILMRNENKNSIMILRQLCGEVVKYELL